MSEKQHHGGFFTLLNWLCGQHFCPIFNTFIQCFPHRANNRTLCFHASPAHPLGRLYSPGETLDTSSPDGCRQGCFCAGLEENPRPLIGWRTRRNVYRKFYWLLKMNVNTRKGNRVVFVDDRMEQKTGSWQYLTNDKSQGNDLCVQRVIILIKVGDAMKTTCCLSYEILSAATTYRILLLSRIFEESRKRHNN